MADCSLCKYAIMDYENFYPRGRWWFVDGCKKGLDDPEEADCPEFEEWEDAEVDDAGKT